MKNSSLTIRDLRERSDGMVSIEHSIPGDNPEVAEAQFVLTVPHDGSSDFQFQKEIQNVIGGIRSRIVPFLQVEQDVGAKAIARSIVTQIQKTLAIIVEVPRGILDVNRAAAHALPVKFGDTESKILLGMHQAILNIINDTLEGASRARGVLDLHTMAPGQPSVSSPVLDLSLPESFSNHMRIWDHATEFELWRPICIIDSLDDGTPVGNLVFAQDMLTAIRREGLAAERNWPLAPNRQRHLGQDFIKSRHRHQGGIAIDIPKDRVCDIHFPDLCTATPNPDKVERMAGLMTEVSKKTFRLK